MDRHRFLLCASLASLVACGYEPPPAGPKAPPFADGPVPFEEVVHISYGKDLEPAEYVFDQQAQWQSFWKELADTECVGDDYCLSKLSAPPEVDFAHHRVVAASLGEGNDGCYHFQFDGMTSMNGEVEVAVSGTHHPCCGCACTLLMTRPFIAAAVPRRPATFRFSWLDVSVTCER